MTIYLAGPVDDVTAEEAQGWRQEVGKHAPTGVLFFDPTTAYHGVNAATGQTVDHFNRMNIAHCDGLLANLTGPGRAFGTVREVEWARLRGKPVGVACENLVSLTAHDLFVEKTVDEALTALMEAIRKQQDAPTLGGLLLQLPPGFPFVVEDGDEDGDDGD